MSDPKYFTFGGRKTRKTPQTLSETKIQNATNRAIFPQSYKNLPISRLGTDNAYNTMFADTEYRSDQKYYKQQVSKAAKQRLATWGGKNNVPLSALFVGNFRPQNQVVRKRKEMQAQKLSKIVYPTQDVAKFAGNTVEAIVASNPVFSAFGIGPTTIRPKYASQLSMSGRWYDAATARLRQLPVPNGKYINKFSKKELSAFRLAKIQKAWNRLNNQITSFARSQKITQQTLTEQKKKMKAQFNNPNKILYRIVQGWIRSYVKILQLIAQNQSFTQAQKVYWKTFSDAGVIPDFKKALKDRRIPDYRNIYARVKAQALANYKTSIDPVHQRIYLGLASRFDRRMRDLWIRLNPKQFLKERYPNLGQGQKLSLKAIWSTKTIPKMSELTQLPKIRRSSNTYNKALMNKYGGASGNEQELQMDDMLYDADGDSISDLSEYIKKNNFEDSTQSVFQNNKKNRVKIQQNDEVSQISEDQEGEEEEEEEEPEEAAEINNIIIPPPARTSRFGNFQIPTNISQVQAQMEKKKRKNST